MSSTADFEAEHKIEADHRKILRDAEVSDDTIELLVQSRVAQHRETAAHNAEVLTEAVRILADRDTITTGTAVSEEHRWGRGRAITETDIDGAFRALQTAAAAQRAEAAEPDVDAIRSTAISGMAHCVTRGDREGLALRIAIAERWANNHDQEN